MLWLLLIPYFFIGLIIFSKAAPIIAWNSSDHYNQKRPDDGDKSNALAAAALIALPWAIVLPVMGIYLGLKTITVKGLARDDFWARPQPIQSPVKNYRENKIKRQHTEIGLSREHINKREAECGMTLTKWND